MYWISMNSVSLIQSLTFFAFPSVKLALGVPKITVQAPPFENPFKNLFSGSNEKKSNIRYAAFESLPEATTERIKTETPPVVSNTPPSKERKRRGVYS